MELNINNFILSKVILNQNIPTYSDNFITKLPKSKLTKEISSKKIKEFYEYKLLSPRFTDFNYVSNFKELTHFFNNPFTQGVITPPTWKGLEMFKSNEDIVLYITLFHEIAFNSIIELGTGNGVSYNFFKDITKNKPDILSFDINGNKNYCDLNNLETLLPYEVKLKKLPKPFLLIEDSHVNVFKTLEYFFKFSTPGCYFYIEDSFSPGKFEEIEKFYIKYQKHLSIDSKYTGMFGTFNSIIIKHIK